VRRVTLIAGAAAAALTAGAVLASPASAGTTPVGSVFGISPFQFTFANEQDTTFTVTLSGGSGTPTPTGQVLITLGDTWGCLFTLVNGTGSCHLSPMQVAPGTYRASAIYSGDSTFVSRSFTFARSVVISP
jgi:Big-like domain-containing protein